MTDSWQLRIAASDFEELRRLVFEHQPEEAGAFALAGVSRHATGSDIVVRRVIAVPPELVDFRHELRLEISTCAVNGLAALCEANGLGAVLCHSHPTETPYSPSDDHGERRVFEAIRAFMPSNAPTASLLFTPAGVSGRAWLRGADTAVPLTEITVVGRQLRRIPLLDAPGALPYDVRVYDRQVRAFGKEGQSLIARAKVGIVGVGGTGSPTAEQLVRLGVRDLVLVDPDQFEDSNLTRVYGTFSATQWTRLWRRAPKRKVDLVARHLRRISPAVRIQALAQNVVLTEAAERLRDRDVVFLCTDDHWGRSVVNQLAYQYLIPAVNVGVAIRAEQGRIAQAVGVIDVLRPDLPCLWCKQFLNSERIAAESMPRRDRKSREREGYVQGIDTPTPAVISITTALSGMAVSVFLQLVTDFMGDAGEVSRLNYDVLQGTVSRGRTPAADRCVCRRARGFGDLKPMQTVADANVLRALE
jgi:hypothetical protein